MHLNGHAGSAVASIVDAHEVVSGHTLLSWANEMSLLMTTHGPTA